MMFSNREDKDELSFNNCRFIYYRLLENNHFTTIPVEAKQIFDKIAAQNGVM